MLINFSNFLFWEVYPNIGYSITLGAIHLIIYDSAGREKIKQFLTTIKIDWTNIRFWNFASIAYLCK